MCMKFSLRDFLAGYQLQKNFQKNIPSLPIATLLDYKYHNMR